MQEREKEKQRQIAHILTNLIGSSRIRKLNFIFPLTSTFITSRDALKKANTIHTRIVLWMFLYGSHRDNKSLTQWVSYQQQKKCLLYGPTLSYKEKELVKYFYTSKFQSSGRKQISSRLDVYNQPVSCLHFLRQETGGLQSKNFYNQCPVYPPKWK